MGEQKKVYLIGSLANVLSVFGKLVDGEDDGATLSVRKRRERGTKSLLQKRARLISKGVQRLSGSTSER